MPVSVLSCIFDVHPATIQRCVIGSLNTATDVSFRVIIRGLLDMLEPECNPENLWLSSIPITLKVCSEGICCMDGMEVEILKPGDTFLQSLLYSTKKKQFSLDFIFICLTDGCVIYKSSALAGKCDDQGGYLCTGIRSKFKNTNVVRCSSLQIIL